MELAAVGEKNWRKIYDTSMASRNCCQFPWIGPVAQWIRHLTTNQGIAGSSPARVIIFGPQ